MSKIKNVFNYVARKELNDKSNRPVKIVDGEDSPRWEGHGWYYETRGGTKIHYPSAYSKVGWSNMVYVNSTLHIVAGKEWLVDKIYTHYPHLFSHIFKA